MSPSHSQERLACLQKALALLDLPQQSSLQQDLASIHQYLNNPNVRIVVFAPFNYGKSTLLNAILGQKMLPIDLIPTTGAAITVRYGPEIYTRIQFTDGQEIQDAGTEVLKHFAILDDQRQMRPDVAAVEVYCPHPFLQTGVELVDLPGTDDQAAQDTLVKQQLLTADLVVQVLDGRKLMTLQEREQLRDWLLDRGIETVVFVVNFLNLLEPDDQKQVLNRLRFVAESFRVQLPTGTSNLYRVDALPALRARLKGDTAAAQVSGLALFESALQMIVQQQERIAQTGLLRLQAIARPTREALQLKIQSVQAEIDAATQKSEHRVALKQKAKMLIKQGFDTSMADLKTWLTPSNLLHRYQLSAMTAIRGFDFPAWEDQVLKADWAAQKQGVVEWVYKACDFFNAPRPADPWFPFPPVPEVVGPTQTSTTPDASSDHLSSTAFATGMGWLLGGPIGAAVLGGASYVFNQATGEPALSTTPSSLDDLEQADAIAVREYLSRFRMAALSALVHYEAEVGNILNAAISDVPPHPSRHSHQLTLLQAVLAEIDSDISL
jgi:signal recognition particle receptor subunit beta